jgi:hypothetical protein
VSVERCNGDPAVYSSESVAELVRSVRRKKRVTLWAILAPWVTLALFLLVFVAASTLGALWAGDLSF